MRSEHGVDEAQWREREQFLFVCERAKELAVGRVTKAVYEAISGGPPVIVYGDGQQSRDFTYVDDIARGTLGALSFLQWETRIPKFEIVTVGLDQPVVLLDAIRLMEEWMGKEARVHCGSCHAGDRLVMRTESRKPGAY
ncbi:MAG: NAD-dependent epimerase/dehydratase family protein [Calditrichaeota bacterium]|nr:NAD-dependent epimerase/dehydratase family protein [Calditrichota bacterium]